MTHRLVVLISGSGSNLQAMIDACKGGQLAANIELVVSNRADAYGLTRAKDAGIATAILSHQEFNSRDAFDQALMRLIDQAQPDTLAMAGFMRILTPAFTQHYQGRLLNIHPSLLPRHKGLDTHQRALDSGDKHHGCSIHFVTAELDGGPIIAQAPFAIRPDDNVQRLTERVHEREHRLYPLVLSWRANDRLYLKEGTVMLDGIPLPPEGYQLAES
jgi:phosphoribosylglycinamide formyltransferase-1